MLDSILKFALSNRLIILALALSLSVFGLYQAKNTPIDVLPDLNRPTVTIMAEAHGLAAENVEKLITWPLEQVMLGAPKVFRVRSSSSLGLAVVNVEFEWGSDIYLNRQIVSERLQVAKARLPDNVSPQLAPVSSILGQVQLIGLQITPGKNNTSLFELRQTVDRAVLPELLTLKGIAQVFAIGGQPGEISIELDIEKLRAYDADFNAITPAILKANQTATGLPVRRGSGGPVTSMSGLLSVADDLKHAVISQSNSTTETGRHLTLGDVAKVQYGPSQYKVGNAGINGQSGVILVVMKQPGIDTVQLTQAVEAKLEELKPVLPKDVKVIPELFKQSAFIKRAVHNVIEAVRDGAILVIIILFMFLLNWRTTIITLSAIPVSLGITALIFSILGFTINTMTLGGIAVAIGTLVDDAIVDVENVFRRLHENSNRANPRPSLTVILDASIEIRKPVVVGTLLVTVVYLPLFFLSGIEGRLFAPIAFAYIISVTTSLFVAMTVTPVLCFYLLGGQQSSEKDQKTRSDEATQYGSFIVRILTKLTQFLVQFSIRYSMLLLLILFISLALVLMQLSLTGSTFLPEFNEGSAQVNLLLPPGTDIEVSDQFGARLEQVLVKVPGVKHVGRRTGRAPGDSHAMPVNVSEAILTFDEDNPRPRSEVIEDIREQLELNFPGIPSATEQPLAHLLSHLLSGVTAQVAIKIYGPNMSKLRLYAQSVKDKIQSIEGVRDLYIEPQVQIEQISIVPDRSKLSQYGLSVADIKELTESLLGSEMVTSFQQGRLSIPVTSRVKTEQRQSITQVRQFPIRTHNGQTILLQDIADVKLTRTPNNIKRENGQRRIVIQHNVGGRALSEVVAEIEKVLKPLREEMGREAGSDKGYYLKIAGQFEAQQEAQRLIFSLSLISLLLIFAILYWHFESVNMALQVLISLPMAAIGAGLAVVLTHQELSVATLVGFIALTGIAARNGILLLDHYIALIAENGGKMSRAILIQAGQERMVPVLMTALTSGIGLLPLAIAADQPGREILYPVATVMIGGLVTTTLLDFIIHPGLFWHFSGAPIEAADLDDASPEA